MKQLHGVRKEYTSHELLRSSLPATPVELLNDWFEAARGVNPSEFNAMCLSTVDAEGRPDARMVLAKDVNSMGVSFFTNGDSQKGLQLKAQPFAALTFYWPELERQIRIRGGVAPLSSEENDAYFQSRPRASQLGAWASNQSRPTDGPDDLQAQFESIEKRFAGQEPIQRPPHWGGFRVALGEVEFWQGRPSRLHHRWRFRQVDGQWTVEGLQP